MKTLTAAALLFATLTASAQQVATKKAAKPVAKIKNRTTAIAKQPVAYAGIKFEHNLSWEQIKAKAKAENKYIFLDGFTTWCGPCRWMAKEVFPQAEAGKFFNANFINVKAQLDTTKNDSEEIKALYKDAHYLMTTYKINVFPTYLFFSPDGELVHRAVGSSPAPIFIGMAKNALVPEKQYYTLKKQYEAGKKDTALLHNLAVSAQQSYDREFIPVIAKEYLATQTDLYTLENLRILADATTKTTDIGFDVFYKNGAKADAVLGQPGISASIAKGIVRQEVLNPLIYTGKQPNTNVDWAAVTTTVKEKYPELADEIILPAQVDYYRRTNNWTKFSETVTAFVTKQNDKVSGNDLNEFAWAIFENCNDEACVDKALAWSKQSLAGENAKNTAFLDTYANLLYKLGKKDEAVKVEEEVVALTKGADPSAVATLDKMKKGEKTW